MKNFIGFVAMIAALASGGVYGGEKGSATGDSGGGNTTVKDGIRRPVDFGYKPIHFKWPKTYLEETKLSDEARRYVNMAVDFVDHRGFTELASSLRIALKEIKFFWVSELSGTDLPNGDPTAYWISYRWNDADTFEARTASVIELKRGVFDDRMPAFEQGMQIFHELMHAVGHQHSDKHIDEIQVLTDLVGVLLPAFEKQLQGDRSPLSSEEMKASHQLAYAAANLFELDEFSGLQVQTLLGGGSLISDRPVRCERCWVSLDSRIRLVRGEDYFLSDIEMTRSSLVTVDGWFEVFLDSDVFDILMSESVGPVQLRKIALDSSSLRLSGRVSLRIVGNSGAFHMSGKGIRVGDLKMTESKLWGVSKNFQRVVAEGSNLILYAPSIQDVHASHSRIDIKNDSSIENLKVLKNSELISWDSVLRNVTVEDHSIFNCGGNLAGFLGLTIFRSKVSCSHVKLRNVVFKNMNDVTDADGVLIDTSSGFLEIPKAFWSWRTYAEEELRCRVKERNINSKLGASDVSIDGATMVTRGLRKCRNR